MRKPDNLFSHSCPLPSTGPPFSTGQEIDTQDTEKRAGEDPSTEPQSKWQQASGKGDGNQGDQTVQDQRSQDRARDWPASEEPASVPGGRRRADHMEISHP